MESAVACPKREDLRRLIRGELSPSDGDRLTQHLGGCPACAAALRSLHGEDTLPPAIPPAPGDATASDAAPADLMRPSLAPACEGALTEATSDSALTLAALNPPQEPGEIGRLAHYRILKVLGEGGMGVVFLAEDVRLSRTVALKTMKPALAADPRHRQRFLREARAAAKVEHDHLVPIYDVGEERGVPWLAMPLLKGQSLNDLLKRVKVLAPGQAVRLGAQVAKGLAAAHAAGLIHRDVKPANIWVESEGGGRAKLLDFGLARDQSPQRERGDEPLTRTGAVVGTPAFMAPEQAGGEPLDARADLFSLGCVLYQAVTGRLPFRGLGMMGTLLALATETPPAPHELNPEVPQPLSALIMNLLAKRRRERPAAAAAVAAALEAMLETPTSSVPAAVPAGPRREESNPWADLTTSEVPPAPVAAPRRWWRLAPLAALLLGLIGVLATGIVVLVKNKDGREGARLVVPDAAPAKVGPDSSGGNKAGPAETTPDHRATQWVLSTGGAVTIRAADKAPAVTTAKELPAGPFQLTVVFMGKSPKATDEDMARLKGLTNLTGLDLGGAVVGDAGLVHLKGLTNLAWLNMDCTGVSDAGMEHLEALSRLTSLGLRGQVSEAKLEHIKGLTNLAQLKLSFTDVTGAEFVHLKGLPKLEALELWGCRRITGEGLDHLKGLRVLNLQATSIDDAGLAHLAGLACLADLNLDDTRVGDAGLVHLKGLSALKHLGLRRTRVTDAGLAQLRALRSLEGLGLDGARVSDAGLTHLKGLPNLSILALSGTRVSDAGLSELMRLPLWDVRLYDSRITAAGIARLRDALPNAPIGGEPKPSAAEDLLAAGATLFVRPAEGKADLPIKTLADLPTKPFFVRRVDATAVKGPLGELLGRLSQWREYEFEGVEVLDLSGCAIDNLGFATPLESLQELNVSGTPITDAALQALEKLPNLGKLDLNQTAVMGRDLGRLAKLPKLTNLSLARSKVSDLFAADVGALAKLERLSLAGCTFSDAGLKHLAGLSNLKELDLTGTQVTADGVAALQKALPKCRILSGPAAK